MKTNFLLSIVFLMTFLSFNLLNAQVGIGTQTPETSALLDLNSTEKGFLLPRMTENQRNAISEPAEGLMVYNLDSKCLNIWNGTLWLSTCGGDGNGNGSDTTQPINKIFGGNQNNLIYETIQTTDGGYVTVGVSNSSMSGDITQTNNGGFDSWVFKMDHNGEIVWSKIYGGDSSDFCRSVKETSDGGYIVFGATNSSQSGDVTETNHGINDYWLFKLNSSGDMQWQKLLGGNLGEVGIAFELTSDGGYMLFGYSSSTQNGDVSDTTNNSATFYTDLWIIKLNSLGEKEWDKLYGGGESDIISFKSIFPTDDGGYVIASHSSSSQSGDITGINTGSNDIWVFKIDFLGNIQWDKLYGGDQSDEVSGIVQTSDGGYLVAGYSYSSNSGSVSDTNHGESDAWIIKLDANGDKVWDRLYGGSGADLVVSMIRTNDNEYLMAGSSMSPISGDITEAENGGGDVWVFKINETGTLLWSKLFGGTGYDYSNSIQQTADENNIVSAIVSANGGDINEPLIGNNMGWIFTIDGSGNFVE